MTASTGEFSLSSRHAVIMKLTTFLKVIQLTATNWIIKWQLIYYLLTILF